MAVSTAIFVLQDRRTSAYDLAVPLSFPPEIGSVRCGASTDGMISSELESGAKVLCLNSYLRYETNLNRPIRDYSLHWGNEVRHTR